MPIYREKNKKQILEYAKEYNLKNKEVISVTAKKWRQKNKEIISVTNKKWVQKNRGKKNDLNSKYRASKLKATPKWLTESDLIIIKAKYQLAAMLNRETEQRWDVDHIIPLKGKEVCGLHVPNNLRVITREENVTKSNKLI